MSGPADVLALIRAACDSDALPYDVHAAVAELIEAMEVAQGDLHMLKRAIEAGDPLPELVIRATDTERDIRAALAKAGSAS